MAPPRVARVCQRGGGSEAGVNLGSDGQDACQETAAYEGGDQGQEDAGDFLEEGLDRCVVLLADFFMEGFAVPDGGAGRLFFDLCQQGIRYGGGSARTQDDLQFLVHDVGAQDAGDALHGLLVGPAHVLQQEAQAGHAVVGPLYVLRSPCQVI